jgi:GNAT superfamily N-acetyltransferase
MLELAAEADDDVLVRRPRQTDEPMLTEHFLEMQAHYGRPVPVSQAMEAARIACRPAVHSFDPRVIVALKDEVIVGSIVLNVMFPAFELTKSLYIRDLYVTATARRCGAGRRLVVAAAQLAAAEGFSALDWTTETTNIGARQMYEACGARQLARTYYRLADEELMLYAGG